MRSVLLQFSVWNHTLHVVVALLIKPPQRFPASRMEHQYLISEEVTSLLGILANKSTSSCKTVLNVPNIGDAKIVVSFRVETFVGAQKASHWNNSCFCPCAQDLKSARKNIFTKVNIMFFGVLSRVLSA